LAWDLANGWIQNAGVSPHSMTDPGETVDLLNLGTVGWHCGNGNQVGIGLEVTGYAAWSFAQWTSGDAFAAVRLDAKRAAEVAAAKGIPLRWLSLSQIRNGERGFCTHADISATLGGTNHTDPGQGFPYKIFMQMVQQWTDGTIGNPGDTPNPQPGTGPGGADPKDWLNMTPEEVKTLLVQVVRDEVGNRLKDLDPVIREVYNRADWINTRTDDIDPVIRETFNRADWTNTNVDKILEKLNASDVPKA
jgi:hypothetical protein